MAGVRIGKKLAISIPLVAAAVLVGYVGLPLYSIGPGPARNVEPLIEVTGHPEYRSEGRFVMTSIVFERLTALGVFLAWLDPDEAVVSEGDLFAPGETQQQERRRAISQMDQSKIDAVYVALARDLGLPLVTWDDEQRTRASTVVTVRTPGEMMAGL